MFLFFIGNLRNLQLKELEKNNKKQNCNKNVTQMKHFSIAVFFVIMYNYKKDRCTKEGVTMSGAAIVNNNENLNNVTEEKILANIEKIERMINPNSKKQIVQLKDDKNFKKLVESVKKYLIEYPDKMQFPRAVYNAASDLIDYATVQFEECNETYDGLKKQKIRNSELACKLKTILCEIQNGKDKEACIEGAKDDFEEDIIETLNIVANCEDQESEDYKNALKILNARIGNLESTLYIEIDIERMDDKTKACSYIGIEVAEALKAIPKPVEEVYIIDDSTIKEAEEYAAETTFQAKPTLLERIKNSKFVRAIKYIMKVRVVLQMPEALPAGRGENEQTK